MEKFLGVLFCGGKGTRLGEITRYVTKPLLPVYDRPIFAYGYALLKQCRQVQDVLILTRPENDAVFKANGFTTLIQDDAQVDNMLSGWNYVKKITGTKAHGILMPGDNISAIQASKLVSVFNRRKADVVFSIKEIASVAKRRQMGLYNPETRRFEYKCQKPSTPFGVLAPYIVRNSVAVTSEADLFNATKAVAVPYSDFWFDVGDRDSLLQASQYCKRRFSNA